MRRSSAIDKFINLIKGREREAIQEKSMEKKTQNKVEISLNIFADTKMKRIIPTYYGAQKHTSRWKKQVV